MDEALPPSAESPFHLQGPHWHSVQEAKPPIDFFPLRLHLQPSGWLVEITRPEMLVGRHSEAELRLALPEVSRQHCRFAFRDGHWEVIDLNSLNGTYVNSQRIQRCLLEDQDQLAIGTVNFLVDLQADPMAGRVPDSHQTQRRLAS